MPSDDPERRYTIGELADAAAVTPRTIRYYTAEELLPPPDSRGKYALYSHEHLLRLRLIARLKDAYLPLGEIRARLHGLSAPQLTELLGVPAEPAARSSAADYVAQVLAGRTQALAEPPSAYAAQAAPRAAQALVPSAPRSPAPLIVGAAEPARAEPLREDAPEEPPTEQRWRRLTLAPGVELHIGERVPEHIQRLAERLLDYARQLLGQEY